jgi:hypothetical protein
MQSGLDTVVLTLLDAIAALRSDTSASPPSAGAETVGRFGGFVAKYMGDGVLIYFGYPKPRGALLSDEICKRHLHSGEFYRFGDGCRSNNFRCSDTLERKNGYFSYSCSAALGK